MTDQLHLGATVDGTGTKTYPDTHTGSLTAHGQFSSANFAICTGSGTYVGTLSPAPTAYVQWMEYTLYISTTNAGAATVNLNTLGAISLQQAGAALTASQLPSGCFIKVIYTGTVFEIIGVSTGSGGSALGEAHIIGAQWESVGAVNVGLIKPVDRFVAAAGTVKSVTVLTYGATGSCTIDIKKGSYTGFPVASSIVAAAPPVIVSGIKYRDAVLTGWTTAFLANDFFRFTLSASTGFTRVAVYLELLI